MSNLQNTNILKEQYGTSDSLNTRISIHEKYSTNKQGFGPWILSNYHIHENDKILECGCGTGDMWKNQLHLLKEGTHLILSDVSQGMLESAKATLGEHKSIEYQMIDIQDIPYANHSFDIVIANMMLYHVPNLDKALSEVKRVLKPNGLFYCATYGEHGIIEHVEEMLGLSSEKSKDKVFTLQNGKEILEKYFHHVECLEYKDALEVTCLDDLLDYIHSLSSMSFLNDLNENWIKNKLAKKMNNGILFIPKEYGMFCVKNED